MFRDRWRLCITKCFKLYACPVLWCFTSIFTSYDSALWVLECWGFFGFDQSCWNDFGVSLIMRLTVTEGSSLVFCLCNEFKYLWVCVCMAEALVLLTVVVALKSCFATLSLVFSPSWCFVVIIRVVATTTVQWLCFYTVCMLLRNYLFVYIYHSVKFVTWYQLPFCLQVKN